jgi:4-alpha-glucanotransferase
MNRKAGILLHITSLPGSSPVGDFGPEAYRFVDFLKEAGQSYWQILPLNQANGGAGHSPYTPLSAFAGNSLFISAEGLQEEQLLSKHFRIKKHLNNGQVDYAMAERYKHSLIEGAFREFKQNPHKKLSEKYSKFYEREQYWLEDYALFMTLKKQHNNQSWNTWPEALRDRNEEALQTARIRFAEQIEYEKFTQFLFCIQWNKLKKYAHHQGIKIFGDVPIYIGYDSADVWSHPWIFRLKENKEMETVAGVPPDYFNEDGQLWNMPIYNWEALQNSGYRWWIDRLKRNLELYDLVRLDHFRGFSAYWEVNASEKTAKIGKWVQGPGKLLFDTLKREFHGMPFAAEDLGDIDQPVYDLRDHYHLPGMRVLQFGFGDDWPHSIHLPHSYIKNCIVYTGTHDNNTVKGWYLHDLGWKEKRHLKSYIVHRLNRWNVHLEIIRLAYNSVARTAIVPIQDILGLGRKARMNFPSTTSGNWLWRIKKRQLKKMRAKKLLQLVTAFGRGN